MSSGGESAIELTHKLQKHVSTSDQNHEVVMQAIVFGILTAQQ